MSGKLDNIEDSGKDTILEVKIATDALTVEIIEQLYSEVFQENYPTWLEKVTFADEYSLQFFNVKTKTDFMNGQQADALSYVPSRGANFSTRHREQHLS